MINLFLSTQFALRLAEEGAAPITTAAFLIALVVVIVLILFNGFFVAAEFAILGSRPARMERLSDEGNATATSVLAILENTDKQNSYLATAQLGITVVTLALAQYGEPRIAKYLEHNVIEPLIGEIEPALLHTIGYIVSLALLTYLHVVIGEMVPKSLALAQPNMTALSLFRPMSILQTILKVPITILNGIGDLLLKILRIKPEHGASRLYSTDEIEQLVSESTEGGLITENAEEIIGNIFDFHDREVGQVMTPRKKLQGIPVDVAYDELIQTVVGSRHSRFPVFEGDLDHIVGILHLKDLLKHYRNGRENFAIRKLLRPTPVVPEDHSVTDLLRAFKLQRIHMAIVIDEYGGVAGIVTLEDLVEEIVGEVRDEFDLEREPMVEIAPGILEMSGDYLLDDLKEMVFLGEDETLPSVDTVGGLMVTHIGGPPAINDEIIINDQVKMRVTGIEGRAVTRLQVEYPVPDESEGGSVEEEDSAETEH